MHQTCRQCSAGFEVTDEDLAFLEEVSPVFAGRKESIPPPTLCPMCRMQRRMAWRNHDNVYRNPNPSKERAGFSMWLPSSPFPFYENAFWFSDDWNPHASAADVDVTQPFFTQFMNVHDRSPHFALDTVKMENSDYCNNADNSKNCYLCFNMSASEDCITCDNIYSCRDCLDCTRVFQCERCVQCLDCDRCYELQDSRSCQNCSNSMFLLNCRSCINCIGCVNLSRGEYCIFNEQKTPEEFAAFMESIDWSSHAARLAFSAQFHEFALQFPQPHAIMRMTENCTGNYLVECHDVKDSTHIQQGEYLRRCQILFGGSHHCHDVTLFGEHIEYCYEGCILGLNAMRCNFCVSVWEGASNLLYCAYCVSCSDCFGCVGLHRKKYCILNKQYTKEEYEHLVPQIIDRMRKTSEWGEFFPVALSPVAYNSSLAQVYFPLDKDEAIARGYTWYEEEPVSRDAMSASDLLDTLPPTDDAIIVKSARSGRPFRISTQEIKRFRQYGVPLPRTTYDERIEERAFVLGELHLYDRTCAKTGKSIRTNIPPDSPWIVWDREEWEREFRS